MNISIVGAGYVGLCTGAAFAKQGHDIVLVEQDAGRREAVVAGKAPFHEPDLDFLLKEAVEAGRLRATDDMQAAVDGTDLTLVCVGTPSAADGSIDLSWIESATAQLVGCIRQAAKPTAHGVLVKSTVVPGTVARLAAEHGTGPDDASQGGALWWASNPEFLKEGTAMADAQHPDRVVVGTDPAAPHAASAQAALHHLYQGATAPSAPLIEVAPTTAEMVKYTANSFLAVKISFANEMANLCDQVGVDWSEVVKGIGDDPRISPQFLRAGVGFGGSCFPKDVAALRALAAQHKVPSGLLEATLARNDAQPLRAVDALTAALGDLAGKRIALLGLSFKPDTDDVRSTRALPIVAALQDAGATVVGHDPAAKHTFARLLQQEGRSMDLVDDLVDALAGADACVVQSEWKDYRALTADHLSGMAGKVVVDGRRALDAKALRAAGFTVACIGDGVPTQTA